MMLEKTRFFAEQWKDRAPNPPAGAEPSAGTVADWFDRFATAREARGLTSVRDDRGRFVHHVAPVFGELLMSAVTRADVERLVRTLDAKVQAEQLSWKTAQNVWMLVSKMFRESVRSKVQELRVRTDNPCIDVAPPDRGSRKAKVYLFPNELGALLSCDRVPLRWRRMVAVSVYLGVRAGELDALQWDDVDLAHGIVHVHRALDRSRPGKAKATKTDTARRFRIEPVLLPLLVAMRAESGGSGAVFPPLKLTGRSEKLRAFLQRAKVDRAELHASDATRKPLGWHDLRATCATWLAVRGDDPLKIMQRLGHRNFNTTMLYVREAEQLREGFGEPFAALPDVLLSDDDPSDVAASFGRRFGRQSSKYSESLSGTRDSNP
jgi:integrase